MNTAISSETRSLNRPWARLALPQGANKLDSNRARYCSGGSGVVKDCLPCADSKPG
jgi:hypothetical protein